MRSPPAVLHTVVRRAPTTQNPYSLGNTVGMTAYRLGNTVGNTVGRTTPVSVEYPVLRKDLRRMSPVKWKAYAVATNGSSLLEGNPGANGWFL